jgi:hypothetical protein
MVYVLMGLEGTGKVQMWRPQAVVTDPTVAEQWGEHGKNVDWVPLELDDVANVSAGPGEHAPTFQPGKKSPVEERLEATAKRQEETIKRMTETIKLLQKRLGIKEPLPDFAGRPQKRSSLLQKKAEDNIPPKPIERVKGGSQPFPETLDAQGIADYIETYATYPVDNQMVYEKFQGAHAVLKLLPIAQLREGGRDHNLQDKGNEAKYLKQSLKTQPPAVVENGEVLDGNHRLRANKRRGLTHMWCYVVMGGEGKTAGYGRNPEDFEGDTIEEQVADLMEKRTFGEEDKGDGWAIYARNTEYPSDATWLKVFFKDGAVTKVDLFDEVPEQVIESRKGFEGLFSFAQAFGD